MALGRESRDSHAPQSLAEEASSRDVRVGLDCESRRVRLPEASASARTASFSTDLGRSPPVVRSNGDGKLTIIEMADACVPEGICAEVPRPGTASRDPILW